MRERGKKLLGLFAGSLLLCAARAGADTLVSGTISTSTTWTRNGSPYIVTGSVTISSSGILTIDSGVVVKFNSGTFLNVYGKLTAVGRNNAPITMTSSQATPAPGAWGSLYFQPGTTPSLRARG